MGGTGVSQQLPEQGATLPGFWEQRWPSPPCLPWAVRIVSPSPCAGLLQCAFLPASGEGSSPVSIHQTHPHSQSIKSIILPKQSLADAENRFPSSWRTGLRSGGECWFLGLRSQAATCHLATCVPHCGSGKEGAAMGVFRFEAEHKRASVSSSPEMGLAVVKFHYGSHVLVVYGLLLSFLFSFPFFSFPPSFLPSLPSSHPINTDHLLWAR